jgi:lipopolysaccharide export system protein LptC
VNSIQNPAYQTGMEVRFAIAARHSRLVRVLRVAVPAAVALSLATVVLISIFNPFRTKLANLPLEIGNLVVSGTKITMESPHLSGFSPDKRPYEMWAKTATQDVTDPDHVELGTLRAKMLMEDQSTITVDARTGFYDTKTQLLKLHKDVFLQTSTGYEARLNSALVNLADSSVMSDEPVDVKLTNGTLRSDRLRVTDNGSVAHFDGNVVMYLVPEHPAEQPPQQPVQEPAPPVTPRASKAHGPSTHRASSKQ